MWDERFAQAEPVTANTLTLIAAQSRRLIPAADSVPGDGYGRNGIWPRRRQGFA